MIFIDRIGRTVHRSLRLTQIGIDPIQRQPIHPIKPQMTQINAKTQRRKDTERDGLRTGSRREPAFPPHHSGATSPTQAPLLCAFGPLRLCVFFRARICVIYVICGQNSRGWTAEAVLESGVNGITAGTSGENTQFSTMWDTK